MSEERAPEQRDDLKRAVSLIIEAGYQIDKEAFSFLQKVPPTIDLDALIGDVLKELNGSAERPLFVDQGVLERKTGDLLAQKRTISPLERAGKTVYRPYAKEVEADFTVVDDPTDKIGATGSLEDYAEYFQDRFRKLRRIMNGRMDARDAGTMLEAFRAPANTKVKVTCMITERRESKRGVFLQVEDLEASATVFVPLENRHILEKAQRLILDQVVCICAVKGKDSLLIAEDIIFPDVPLRKPNKSPVPVYAALLSDLHVGSKMFMKTSFRRFILWLRGKVGDPHLREMAGRIKYVLIAGDIVDGVGIYPQQSRELRIKDIYRQYRAAAKMIEHIPDYVEVVIIPGNHDASRRALPQPAIPRQYAEPIYEGRMVYSLGSPSVVSLEGVTVLMDHGRSLDDVIATVPRMSFQVPDDAMKFLLQCRHLAPAYGLRTLIASERIDHLVVERVPDIFHAGHVHMMSYSSYRGTLVVNSGAWQTQTEYQREMGHIPNPGIVPIVNLQDLEVTPVSFVPSA